MEEILLSGKATFNMEVPYKLIEVGEEKSKPLIVYLHGFKQNISDFQQQVASLLSIKAYHLFVQGPYPIYDRRSDKKVEEWGRAWYLYDGNQAKFVSSLEQTSAFLQQILDRVYSQISLSRTALVGYSMGGYLAGYFSLSRYKYINELVVIGSRIKTEVFEQSKGKYDDLNVLALHGRQDVSVKSQPQKRSCEVLSDWGANVTFKALEEGHRLNESYLSEVKKWFSELGYE